MRNETMKKIVQEQGRERERLLGGKIKDWSSIQIINERRDDAGKERRDGHNGHNFNR